VAAKVEKKSCFRFSVLGFLFFKFEALFQAIRTYQAYNLKKTEHNEKKQQA